MEVGEEGLKLSITEGGKEGKSNVTASCSFLEEKFQEFSNREGGERRDEQFLGREVSGVL